MGLRLKGRIKINDNSNIFIFIAINHYTKWIETKILKNKTANEIIKSIKTLIIQKHGIPKGRLFDSGLEFVNKDVGEYTDKQNIERIMGTPYHHNTFGAVEIAIQTFTNKLRKITEFGTEYLTRNIEKATFAYNISFNRVINTSPQLLKYGPVLQH